VCKESIVVLICMKGDKTDSSDYTGAILLSATYKILYKVLLKKLTPHAEDISEEN